MKIISDASVYSMETTDIQTPDSVGSLVEVVRNSLNNKLPITMRAGGTSLAGQAVGSGVVIDISKHLNSIIDLNVELKEVVVEPGVIQDDLNKILLPHGLRFAPDTATSNRAMIGGMIGNNSCGSF